MWWRVGDNGRWTRVLAGGVWGCMHTRQHVSSARINEIEDDDDEEKNVKAAASTAKAKHQRGSTISPMKKRGSMAAITEASALEAKRAMMKQPMTFPEVKEHMRQYSPQEWARVDELFRRYCDLRSVMPSGDAINKADSLMDLSEWNDLLKDLNIVPDYLSQVFEQPPNHSF
eukprot:2779866-Rhodomonas_salina.2